MLPRDRRISRPATHPVEGQRLLMPGTRLRVGSFEADVFNEKRTAKPLHATSRAPAAPPPEPAAASGRPAVKSEGGFMSRLFGRKKG